MELNKKAVVCVSCGVSFDSINKFCPNCGVETNPNDEVCTKFGIRLVPSAVGKSIRTTIMDYEELKLSLIISWLVLSLVTFCILILPYILSEESIHHLVPKCEWKTKYNKECPLCGMTTAFINISKGNFKKAYQANRGSLFLYAFFLLNQIIVFVYLKRLLKHCRYFLVSKITSIG
jgi:predicted RNA-binding Zn-ribbon protein involved in translation (DUF1610 family)